MGQAWAAADAGDRFNALRAFSQVLLQEPGNADARRAVANLLYELGAPFGAAAAQSAAPVNGASPPDLGLRSRQAALMVRWGHQIKLLDSRQRYATTDLAIARLKALLQEAAALQPLDSGLEIRLQRDLATALRDRKRWQEVLDTTAALRAQGDEVPAYVRHAEADALLALRRPQEARVAYAQVLAADPQNIEALDGRFYAEVEAEDFAAALATADAALAAQSPSRNFGSAARVEANPDWLDAQIRAAQARSYAELPAQAWERLLPLAEGAPALGYLRAALGGVAAQRGWPRRAEQEVSIARGLAPDDMGMAVAMLESDLRRRQWARAQSALVELQANYADDGAVQRAARDFAHYQVPELRLETSTHQEDGGGINAPGAGNDTSVHFYTSPLAERWRIAAAASRSTASLPEGNFARERLGAGLEARWPDVTVEALAWSNRSVIDATGSSLQARWEPTDHWSFEGQAEQLAADTPLRALVYGVTANLAGAAATYTWNEERSVTAQWRSLNFSDGNLRNEAALRATQRVLTQPGLTITLNGGLNATTNSLTTGPYFSPSSDTALDLGAQIDHMLWRAYEQSFQHRLHLGAGVYQQSGYSGANTGSVRYEQEYRKSPFSALRYGVEWSQRVYDGNPERTTKFYLAWEQSFR